MTEWKARRFWTEARVERVSGGWTVELDGRPVRSPLKTLLVMPSRSLAQGVADEWDAQVDVIDPLSMPLTRAVNAALDKVVPQRAEVAQHLAAYGESDLLCYRADSPDALAERQAAAWDPWLDWMAAAHAARLAVTTGVMPAAQPANAVSAIRVRVHRMTAWELTAFSEFVTLTGSLVLGLAVFEDRLPPEEAWTLSRVDEAWQIEQWGEDADEAERVARKRDDFLQARRYLDRLRAD